MKKIILFILFLFFLLQSLSASDITLKTSLPQNVKLFLKQTVILKQIRNEYHLITIYREHHTDLCEKYSGDKINYARYCPSRRLYIAVSGYDEDPDFEVFISEDASDWDFVKVLASPKNGEKENTVILLKKYLENSDDDRDKSSELLVFNLNPYSATVRKYDKKQ